MDVTSTIRSPIGLLAAAGRFPIAFADKARKLGLPVVCVGIRHQATPVLASLVTEFYWAGAAKMGRVIRLFKQSGVHDVVMAGKFQKTELLRPFRVIHLLPDLRTLRFWYDRSRRDNRDDTILLGIIAEFARDGLRFGSALEYCPELLVKTGILTRRGPTPFEFQDISMGWEMAREMGRLDVGQSVAIYDRAVLAVEAIEGTDQMIARAGQLCRRGGFVVVKVAKPSQDMRFDVPTVGCTTIEGIHRAGGRLLAIEAGRTILLDEAETIALANKYGITIVAVSAEAMAQVA